MKKCFLTKTWFWAMIIAINITLANVIPLINRELLMKILKSECLQVAIGSIGTLASVFAAAASLKRTEKRKKKQATYDAYQQFKKEVFEFETKIEKRDLNKLLELHKQGKNVECWNCIKMYLTRIERIATCVNSDIFDIETIYNMGGPYMIKQFDKFLPIINYKRSQECSNGVYYEFEKMVNELRYLDSCAKKQGKYSF